MVTLPLSLIALVWMQVKSYYCKIVASSTLRDVKRKVFMAPIFLIKNTFFLGTIVLIAVMDQWVCLINLFSYLLTLTCYHVAWAHMTGGIIGK